MSLACEDVQTFIEFFAFRLTSLIDEEESYLLLHQSLETNYILNVHQVLPWTTTAPLNVTHFNQVSTTRWPNNVLVQFLG